ncbi:MAG: hopanoid biosynthesis-associated RND transporter HpnN, partial [Hyphomonadaceae bacterium]
MQENAPASESGPKTPLQAISAAVAAIVARAIKRPLALTIFAVALGLASLAYVIDNFEIRTDLDSLISADLSWRAESAALEAQFPTEGDDIVLVIDGATPELAERAAAAFVEKLAPRTDLFAFVARENGGPFFDREGLLFSALPEVQKTIDALIAAQPILGPIASDPSLRGLMGAVATTASAADPARMAQLARPMRAITETLAKVEAGQGAYLSWRTLLSEEAETPNDWRQFITLTPKLNYSELLPSQGH